MKRAALLIIILCAMLVPLTGCGAGTASPAQTGLAEDAVTFTDDLGREVTLTRPERTAVLTGSFADIWCLAGGKETLAAAPNDTWTEFELGLPESVVNIGAIKEPNLELLLSAQPDLIIASANTAAQVELLDTLEQTGIPTAYFKVASVDDYLRMLEICTELTGCAENYALWGTAVAEQVEQARQRADGSSPTVLYVRATGSSCKVKNSEDSVLGEMLADMGCVNIADSDTALLEDLSLEKIVAEDPQMIFIVVQGSDPTDAQKLLETTLLDNPAWQGLSAVRAGRVYYMDNNLYNLKPNARWGEAYEKLANILYPAA